MAGKGCISDLNSDTEYTNDGDCNIGNDNSDDDDV